LKSKLQESEQRNKDLEVKLFEKSSVTNSDFVEENAPLVSNPFDFDEMPLPTTTSNKKLDFGFSANANRSKASSISFGDVSETDTAPPVFKTPHKQVLKENNGGLPEQDNLVKDLKNKLKQETQENAKLNNEMTKKDTIINQLREKLQIADCQR